MTTGMFSRSGAVRKCSSTSYAPASSSSKWSMPMTVAIERPYGRPQVSTGRRPSPRTRTCSSGSIPNPTTASRLVDSATKCLATASSVPSRLDEPPPRGTGVGEGLLRGEGLGGNDEQRRFGPHLTKHLAQVRTIDVRHEVRAEPLLPVRTQRLGDHHRAEVGAADADVDDVGDGAPVYPIQPPSRTARRTRASARAHVAHPASRPRRRRRRAIAAIAKGGVEDRPALGFVDGFAREHARDPIADSTLLAELRQQREGLIGDAISWRSRREGRRA